MKKVGQSIIPMAIAVFLLCLAGMAVADDNKPVYPGYTQMKPDPPGMQVAPPAFLPGKANVFSPDMADDRSFPRPFTSGDMTLLADPPMTRTASLSEYWIGVQCEEVAPVLKYHLNLTEHEGMLVEAVMPESPAAKSGVERYDVILAINDKPVGTLEEIVNMVDEVKDGEMTISAIRKGKPVELKITPEKRPESAKIPTEPPRQGFFRFGPGAGAIKDLPPSVPQQVLPEDFRQMLEQMQKQIDEQMRNLPESRRFRTWSPPGGGGEMPFFGGPGAGANTMQITIEPAREDAEATLTVRKNGQTWSVSQFSDLPESVQKDVVEILKTTVDDKDVAEWIGEQMKSNRRLTFSVTITGNATE